MTNDESTFGLTLRRYRRSAGLTQEELAERAEVSARTISDVERGVRPSVYRDTAIRLGTALGLEGEHLEGFERSARRGPHRVVLGGIEGLPPSPTRLVGRGTQLERLLRTLVEPGVHLVTLTGPGGIGKSRLALEAAAKAGPGFPDGVRFVPLAADRDPALLIPILTRALGADRTGGSGLGPLVEHLATRRILLVLDTFEHLLAAAPTLSELLSACPGIRALVTSRAPLHVRGERVEPVMPLEVPAGDDAPERSPSVELFVERVTAVRPDLADADPATLATVADICRRLEGVPLAIELAAARVKHLPLEALHDRLGRRLSILTGGPRDTAPRQQTMRDTIAWSYELLAAPERSLLRTLSVFDDGWDLESASAVAQFDEDGALAGISALVDGSLASLEPAVADRPRYRMLDVVREFGAERVADEAGTDQLQRRHGMYFLSLAERAEPHFGTGMQGAWCRRLETDIGNVRSGMAWALDSGDETVSVRFAGALWQFWRLFGGFTEGRRFIDAAIAMEGADTTSELPKALWGAAWLAYHQDDFARAESLGLSLIEVARERALPLDERNGLTVRGQVAVADGRFADALELFGQSVQICAAMDARWHLATSFFNLGQAALLTDDPSEARRLWKAARAVYLELGDEHFAARLQGHLGYPALLAGDLVSAATSFISSLEAFRELGDDWGVAEAMERSVALTAARGDDEHAARIAGAAEALRERLAARAMPFDRLVLEPYLAASRSRLGSDRWHDLSDDGRQLPLDEAIDLASR